MSGALAGAGVVVRWEATANRRQATSEIDGDSFIPMELEDSPHLGESQAHMSGVDMAL